MLEFTQRRSCLVATDGGTHRITLHGAFKTSNAARELTRSPLPFGAAQSAAVVNTGDAVSRILVVWWKREAVCAASRLNKSASLLTACIVFRVAAGDPVFQPRTAFLV